MVERLETRRLLASGPRITAITPTELINATFDHVDVAFNEAIDPTTFTTVDVSLSGPPDVGAVNVTGVTQLDATDYRVSFGALSERGTYQVAIGPNIADPQGNLMDQNQNGVNGEPGDQFASALNYVVAQTVFTTNTVIHEMTLPMTDRTLPSTGRPSPSTGRIHFDSVHMVDGAVLTHSANTATQTHELDLTIAQQVIVDATSEIDVSGKGYQCWPDDGNTTVGAATGSSGASYGGLGGLNSNRPYGDYADPNDWGSGASAARAVGWSASQRTPWTLTVGSWPMAWTRRQAARGGGVYITVTTFAGHGSISAAGGNNTEHAGNGGPGGGGGGGGRVAVYAADLSGFDTSKITAFGGTEDNNPGGAGTVYLRDPDESNGTLIIDAGSGGGGVTPLGLPGQSSFAIPDAVVIRGARTEVQPEHTGLVLEFQNNLTVDQSATLKVEAAGFITDQSATVLGGATLNVSGAYAPPLPPVVTGGDLNVSGDLTLAAPLQATNASVSVDGTLTSTVPQTISGGTITTDNLVAPTWSLVKGAILTSFASTTTQMHKLEVQVDGTLSVDATSEIDVSGKGYQAGRTTGNTTVGAATGSSGASYGGLGGLNSNRPYGDYADPNDWGSGASAAGGGLVRVTADTLDLDGRIVANGVDATAGSAGGGVYITVTTFAGPWEHQCGGRE